MVVAEDITWAEHQGVAMGYEGWNTGSMAAGARQARFVHGYIHTNIPRGI